jgi:hypothetical protein
LFELASAASALGHAVEPRGWPGGRALERLASGGRRSAANRGPGTQAEDG